MSTKDYAISVLDTLSEEQLREFIRLFADEDTLVRMESNMLADSPTSKRYSGYIQFLRDVGFEEDTE